MHLRLLRPLILAILCASPLVAKPSTWTDAQGATFKAEPTEVLGAFAIFRQNALAGKRVLLRGLPAEECVRFYQETAGRPERSADFAHPTGLVSQELPGKTLVVRGKELVRADLSGRPEPALYLVLYASHNDGESWAMLNNITPTYRRLKTAFPDVFEGVFFGVRHTAAEHTNIAVGVSMPWLVCDPNAQSSMTPLARFAPGEGILLLALTREGVPLISSRGETLTEITRFVDELNKLAELAQPDSVAGWRDRLHYAQATRPVQFASSTTPPALVHNPLRADALRQRGLREVRATVTVGPDGVATGARLTAPLEVAPALVPELEKALVSSARYAPAIDHGKPVSGDFPYTLTIPETDRLTAAERAWLETGGAPEVPLPRWLVLGPIPVPEQAFSGDAQLGADGVYTMKQIEVASRGLSKAAQLGAFNSDWFTAEGAASVQPKVGDSLSIDGNTLTWRLVAADQGYVDLQSGRARDYCIGYATAEIEVDRPMNALLGIGSDDGLKIWCNGDLVADAWVRRLSRIDDNIVPITLRPGRNRLLLKIQNAIGDWSFRARLRLLPR